MNRLITLFAREAALWAAILVAILMTIGLWVTVQEAERRFAEARRGRALLIEESGRKERALDATRERVAEIEQQLGRLEIDCGRVHQETLDPVEGTGAEFPQ